MLIKTFGKTPRDRVLEIEAPAMRLEGWVTVQLGRNLQKGAREKPIILRELKFRNLIVDAGYDQVMGSLSSINAMCTYMGVGTSSTAPANSDTALGASLGRTNSNGGFADAFGDGASYTYRYFQRTRLFLEGEVNGNLTEVGFFKNASGAPMWMRQLFKDGGGTPTTIVKTSADQLKVIYELRVYTPPSDVTSSISISSTSYTYVHRAADIDGTGWSMNPASTATLAGTTIASGNGGSAAHETGTLGATTGIPSGTQVGASSDSWAAYTPGTFYRDLTSKWEPAVANFAGGIGSTVIGIGSFTVGSVPHFQTSWSPAFTKDNTKRLTLVTRISMAVYP